MNIFSPPTCGKKATIFRSYKNQKSCNKNAIVALPFAVPKCCLLAAWSEG